MKSHPTRVWTVPQPHNQILYTSPATPDTLLGREKLLHRPVSRVFMSARKEGFSTSARAENKSSPHLICGEESGLRNFTSALNELS